MRVLRFWRLGLGAAVALGVGAALAADPLPTYPECTKKPSPQDIEGAKGAHKAATQFYDRGDYDKAVRYWNDALGFDCTANDLLINIANAYEKNSDLAATVATLEAYQKRTGLNPTIDQKIKNLKAKMAQPAATVAPTVAPTATAAPTVTAAPTAVPTTAPPPEGQRPFGNTPWIVVGGGGALAIVGAILLPVGYGAISSASSNPLCKEMNGTRVCPPDIAAQGNTGRTEAGAGWGLLAVGLAAAGGGLFWQLALNKPKPLAAPGAAPQQTGLWVTPAAGSGRTGVVVGGSF